MHLLQYLVFFLTFLGLSPHGASACSHASRSHQHGIIGNADYSPVNTVFMSHTGSPPVQVSNCSLPFDRTDFDVSNFNLRAVDFIQRYANFHWFWRKRTVIAPPAIQVNVVNYCGSSTPLCSRLVKEIPDLVLAAVQDVNDWLYTSAYNVTRGTSDFCPKYPQVSGIEVILGVGRFDALKSVAYVPATVYPHNTMRIHLDDDFIERSIRQHPRWKVEKWLLSTITHEVVHTLQHGAVADPTFGYWGTLIGCDGLAPQGLIEGIAEFVALKAGKSSPAWGYRPLRARERQARWDTGYIGTAWFLEWLEDVRLGPGSIGRLNDRMGKYGYFDMDETMFDSCLHQPDTWKTLFGISVTELWEEYGQYLDKKNLLLHHIVEVMTHPFSVIVLLFSIFFEIFWGFVASALQGTELAQTRLLGTSSFWLYLGRVVYFFRSMTFSQLWDILGGVTIVGMLVAFTVASYLSLNYMTINYAVFNMYISNFDAAVVGSAYGLMWMFLNRFVDNHQFDNGAPAVEAGHLGKLFTNTNFRDYHNMLLAVFYGTHMMIVHFMLSDMGVSTPALLIGFLVGLAPFYLIRSIVATIDKWIVSIADVGRRLMRRT